MFSIYGVTGQTFHGSLEPLIQVPGVIAHHGRGMVSEGEEPGAETPRAAGRTDQDGANDEAATRGMRHQETEHTQLYHAYQIMSWEVTAVAVAGAGSLPGRQRQLGRGERRPGSNWLRRARRPPICFLPFMLMAFPLMLASIAVSSGYLWLRYL